MSETLKKIITAREPSIGLAIGESKVRAMQISGDTSKGRIVAFAEAPVQKGVFSTEGLVDSHGFAKSVEMLFNSPLYGKFSGDGVVVNLPESKCFVRAIHMNDMTDSEIDAAVPFEAESYIPVPIDQVYLDWMRIGEQEGRASLLLVASPKSFVDQVLDGLDIAGMRPLALEVESLALVRALIQPGDKETVLIADMRASKTDLIMVERGAVQFTSTIPVAGTGITDSIAKGLEIDTKRAEEIKESAGFRNTEEYPNLKTLILPVLNTFISEVKQVIQFHEQHHETKVVKVLLAGGAAKLKGIDEFVKTSLQEEYKELVVELGDPTVNLHVDLPVDLQSSRILDYATSIGLAMRGFKL